MELNKTLHLKINGMHCDGCANKIKNGLQALKINHDVHIDVPSGAVDIKFNNTESSVSMLKESIAKLGFQIEKLELE